MRSRIERRRVIAFVAEDDIRMDIRIQVFDNIAGDLSSECGLVLGVS